jgi:hypothetical protein
MEALTLPSVGGSFKKWVYCASIFPKCLEVPQNFQKNFFFKTKKNQKIVGQACGQRAITGRRPVQAAESLVARQSPTSGRDLVCSPSTVHGSHFVVFASPCFHPASPVLPPLPQLLGTLVSSTSLAPAHARPTQRLPKNFKHP